MQRLSYEAAIRGLETVVVELGSADRSRVQALSKAIAADGRIRLDRVLDALYAGQDRTTALSLFRQLRARLRAAAKQAGINLQFVTDDRKRTIPSQRWCWFTGDDAAVEAATGHADLETAGIDRVSQDAIEMSLPPRRPKPRLRCFVSYAHDDIGPKKDLLNRLRKQLANVRHFECEFLDDGGIEAGRVWSKQIESNISTCDFGLLLVSPAFLASDFIVENELPRFLPIKSSKGSTPKPSVPVALKPFRMDRHAELHGLEALQIVFQEQKKTFQDCINERARDAFAAELRDRIIVKFENTEVISEYSQLNAEDNEPLANSLRVDIDSQLEGLHLVPPHGRESTLAKLARPGSARPSSNERRDALDFLMSWVKDANGPACCALLGDYGMGKTTTCKAFTQRMLRAHQKDPSCPLPIYLAQFDFGVDFNQHA